MTTHEYRDYRRAAQRHISRTANRSMLQGFAIGVLCASIGFML